MAKTIYSTITEYIGHLPDTQRPYVEKLRNAILKSIDREFQECMSYGMIGYVVPHSKYAEGYHCDPKLPLPFAGLAAQKNFIAVYHMGIYSSPELLKWFQESYTKACKSKLDMGKSCIRLKKYEDIPYELFTELFSKITANQWISMYEKLKQKK